MRPIARQHRRDPGRGGRGRRAGGSPGCPTTTPSTTPTPGPTTRCRGGPASTSPRYGGPGRCGRCSTRSTGPTSGRRGRARVLRERTGLDAARPRRPGGRADPRDLRAGGRGARLRAAAGSTVAAHGRLPHQVRRAVDRRDRRARAPAEEEPRRASTSPSSASASSSAPASSCSPARWPRPTPGRPSRSRFVIAGVACALAALCYAEFASTVPVAGQRLHVQLRHARRAGRLDHRLGPRAGVHDRGRRRWPSASPATSRSVARRHAVRGARRRSAPPADGVVDLPAVLIALLVTGVLIGGIKLSSRVNQVDRRDQAAGRRRWSSSSASRTSSRPTTRRSSRRRSPRPPARAASWTRR